MTTLTTSLGPTELALAASAVGASLFNYYVQAPGDSGPTLIVAGAGSIYAIAVPTVPGDYIDTAAAVIGGVEQAMSALATVTVPA